MVMFDRVEYTEHLWAPMTQNYSIAEKVRAEMRGICPEVQLKECQGRGRWVSAHTKGIIPHGSRKAASVATILRPNSAWNRVNVELMKGRLPTPGKRKRYQAFNGELEEDATVHAEPGPSSV